jgi:hypothetical protein
LTLTHLVVVGFGNDGIDATCTVSCEQHSNVPSLPERLLTICTFQLHEFMAALAIWDLQVSGSEESGQV